MKLKEQLENCTQKIWPQSSGVFNEGHSFFPELCPSNIFSMILTLCSMLLLQINLSLKKYVFKWGILKNYLQQQFSLPAPISA